MLDAAPILFYLEPRSLDVTSVGFEPAHDDPHPIASSWSASTSHCGVSRLTRNAQQFAMINIDFRPCAGLIIDHSTPSQTQAPVSTYTPYQPTKIQLTFVGWYGTYVHLLTSNSRDAYGSSLETMERFVRR